MIDILYSLEYVVYSPSAKNLLVQLLSALLSKNSDVLILVWYLNSKQARNSGKVLCIRNCQKIVSYGGTIAAQGVNLPCFCHICDASIFPLTKSTNHCIWANVWLVDAIAIKAGQKNQAEVSFYILYYWRESRNSSSSFLWTKKPIFFFFLTFCTLRSNTETLNHISIKKVNKVSTVSGKNTTWLHFFFYYYF